MPGGARSIRDRDREHAMRTGRGGAPGWPRGRGKSIGRRPRQLVRRSAGAVLLPAHNHPCGRDPGASSASPRSSRQSMSGSSSRSGPSRAARGRGVGETGFDLTPHLIASGVLELSRLVLHDLHAIQGLRSPVASGPRSNGVRSREYPAAGVATGVLERLSGSPGYVGPCPG